MQGSAWNSNDPTVEEHVDDVKTDAFRRSLTVANELLQRLRLWKQSTQFAADGDWIFASSLKIGRLPYSYTGEIKTRTPTSKVGVLVLYFSTLPNRIFLPYLTAS